MAKKDRPSELWKAEPEEHDFPAAADSLSLLLEPVRADSTVALLRRAVPVDRKAKDLLRASRLSVLPVDDVHVVADLRRSSGASGSHRSCWCEAGPTRMCL